MADTFETYSAGLESPVSNAAAVTPDNGTDLAFTTRGLVIGGAGTVTVDMAGTGTNITLTLPAGVWPLRVTRVYATGTAATGIVAIW